MGTPTGENRPDCATHLHPALAFRMLRLLLEGNAAVALNTPLSDLREVIPSNKLRGLSPRENYTNERLTLVGKINANYCR
jgi:hypothetical protein